MSDRKYRHRGYQDGGGFGSHTGGPQRPMGPRPEPQRERMEDAPRGRTAGGFGPDAFKCTKCGLIRHTLGDLQHDEACGGCGGDLHTCGNCRFFDSTTLWECRENIPARVVGKNAKNECTFFQPKIIKDLSADKATKPMTENDARKAFDALFKK